MCLQSIGGLARTVSEMVRKTWASLDLDIALLVAPWACVQSRQRPQEQHVGKPPNSSASQQFDYIAFASALLAKTSPMAILIQGAEK